MPSPMPPLGYTTFVARNQGEEEAFGWSEDFDGAADAAREEYCFFLERGEVIAVRIVDMANEQTVPFDVRIPRHCSSARRGGTSPPPTPARKERR